MPSGPTSAEGRLLRGQLQGDTSETREAGRRRKPGYDLCDQR